MSLDLGRRLIATGLVSSEEVEAALFLSVARGLPFARVLLDRGAVTERALEAELERMGGLALRQVTGAPEIVKRLPRAMCRRLGALPTRVDPATGTVDVAAADPLDAHVSAEFSFHLGAPIRVLRAPIAAVEEAIRRLELDDGEPAGRVRSRRVTPPFPHGAPQSTIPPPIADEAPIPLVRRLSAPIEGSVSRSGGTLVPPSGAPPLSEVLSLGGTPGPPAPVSLAAPRPMTPAPAEARQPAEQRRGRSSSSVLTIPTGTDDEPPSVSFPSMPPAAEDTPPHGSRVFSTDRSAIRSSPEPEVYRIAPPAAEAYPLRATKPTAHADAHARPSGEIASGEVPANGKAPARRLSRPSLAAVPYPGPAPAPQDPRDQEEAGNELRRRRVRAPDASATFAALRVASSRDDVVRRTLRGMRLVARRFGVFAVRKDGFHGWACNVELGDEAAFQDLFVPNELPSVLATATATAMYLGPIPATAAHEGLLGVMDRSSPDVAAVAVRVAGRPVLVLLCDDLEDTLVGTRFLAELAHEVGEALTRLISR